MKFSNLASLHRHNQVDPQNPNRRNQENPFAESSSSTSSSSSELRESESGYESASDGEVEEMSEYESASSTMSLIGMENKDSEIPRSTRMDFPPSDDCCPICFSNFVVPCRGPCGHWYCGGCILQYWNYSAALQPCNCPMCARQITKLTAEASLYLSRDVEVTEVLGNVRRYNRLFVGGTYGFVLKILGLPLYVKRVFYEMMNPDRPGAHLNKLRICAMFLGLLYTFSPFDFLRIGRQNVIDVFDYSAIALSFILYMVGLYLRRRRFQQVREIAAIDV